MQPSGHRERVLPVDSFYHIYDIITGLDTVSLTSSPFSTVLRRAWHHRGAATSRSSRSVTTLHCPPSPPILHSNHAIRTAFRSATSPCRQRWQLTYSMTSSFRSHIPVPTHNAPPTFLTYRMSVVVKLMAMR